MGKLSLDDFIIEPVMTEKSTALSASGKFVFKVHQMANKPMIKTALEKIYGVRVKSIAVINQKGRRKRTKTRNMYTYLASTRKAIVTLKEGQFSFFETMK